MSQWHNVSPEEHKPLKGCRHKYKSYIVKANISPNTHGHVGIVMKFWLTIVRLTLDAKLVKERNGGWLRKWVCTHLTATRQTSTHTHIDTFTRGGKCLDCGGLPAWCLCPSDRIIAKSELKLAFIHAQTKTHSGVVSSECTHIYTAARSTRTFGFIFTDHTHHIACCAWGGNFKQSLWQELGIRLSGHWQRE